MRKIKITIIAIILILVSVLLYTYKNTPRPISKTAVAEKSSADLAFSVVGDVHENIDNFQMTINDFNTINPYMDALVLNGDTVDQGIEKQYESVKKVLSKNKDLLPKTIIKNIGNHEFFDYDVESNSKEQVQTFIEKYLEFSGEGKVYHDAWVKNYHFISLGSEDGNSKRLDSISAFISDEQISWFKGKLAENYEKGKPIFVFLHQPLYYGNKNIPTSKQSGQINEILAKYPEAILFSSHTHRDLNDESVIIGQPYTSINSGSIHYTLIPDANSENGRKRMSFIKGLYIEVHGNNVVVKGRDIKEKKWLFTKEIKSE